MERPSVELILFPWPHPDDATEGVTEHSIRLQPSINLHTQLQPLCSAALVSNVLPRRDKSSGKPCACGLLSIPQHTPRGEYTNSRMQSPTAPMEATELNQTKIWTHKHTREH